MSILDGFLKGFDEGYELAKDGVTLAAEKAEDMSYAARVKLRIFGLKRKLDKNYTALGRSVYTLFKAGEENPHDNEKVQNLLSEIATIDDEIVALIKELEEATHKEESENGEPEVEVVESEVVDDE